MKTNLIDLYGVALQAPKISEDRKKAMITLKVARNLARGGQSEERSGYWDEIIIRSKDPKIVEELSEMDINEIIRVKGVLTIKPINRSSICPGCGIKNIFESVVCYVEPIYVESTKSGLTKEEAEEFIFNHREVSNILRVVGDLCNDPNKNTRFKSTVCQYQIGIPRTYRIEGDTDDDKTDFPLVKSYSKNAKEDLKRLQKGSTVLIDGCIQSRVISKEIECENCKRKYKKEFIINEIVPYETEYLKNYKTDVE